MKGVFYSGDYMKDLTDLKFGSLTAIKLDHVTDYRAAYWLCLCSCGKEHLAQASNLQSGRVASCGCERSKRISKGLVRHGATSDLNTNKLLRKAHWCWGGIKQRCYNARKGKIYSRYQGRGIKVCDRWINSFETFLKDMGLPPTLKHSLDRYPNNDGNYEPSNCRWATSYEQMNNIRTNHIIEYNGQKKTIAEWVIEKSIPRHIIKWRIDKGWAIDDIFEKPFKKYKQTHKIGA